MYKASDKFYAKTIMSEFPMRLFSSYQIFLEDIVEKYMLEMKKYLL
ncbi:hypothetical protein LIY46_00840 [Fusobacterium varium]|nr:hypothetical protein [Fusobacterium ulcerans]